MPFITCSQCHACNRIPHEKENLRRKGGRCDQLLPSCSLQHPTEPVETTFVSLLNRYADLLPLIISYSPPCGLCQMLAPPLKAQSLKFKGLVAVGKLSMSSKLQRVHRYKISWVPTFIPFETPVYSNRL